MPITRGNLVPARILEVGDFGEPKLGGVFVICMFNPFEYTLSKQNTYQERSRNRSDAPQVEFTKAGAQTLKLSLVFDTYESGEPVNLYTDLLWKMMESKTRPAGGGNKKIPPPEVAFEWGVFRFVAVITTMTQKFTLFKADGMPVRAKADVTFTQHKDKGDFPFQNPTSGGGDVSRVWRVIAGDRLDNIAHEVYGDSTKWRLIAEFNQISNPFGLRAGQQIAIPEQ